MNDWNDYPGDEPTEGLPVISGRSWFDIENRPFVLRVECPLAVDEVVAVLYGTAQAGDLASDEELCGSVVVTLLIEGLLALHERAEKLRADESHGMITSPAFLSLCRQRVAAMTGQ